MVVIVTSAAVFRSEVTLSVRESIINIKPRQHHRHHTFYSQAAPKYISTAGLFQLQLRTTELWIK